ncbi:MAG: carboxypeptidase regulatory-like domain-containing protein [Elusimicrobiota bacterium]
MKKFLSVFICVNLWFLICVHLCFSATLKVKMLDGSNNQPLDDVTVMAVGFLEGQDEPLGSVSKIGKTNTEGIVEFNGLVVSALDKLTNTAKNVWYKVIFAKHKYFPTVTEQISGNLQIPTHHFTSDTQVIPETGYHEIRLQPQQNIQAGILNIVISTTAATPNTMMWMDLRHKITGEPVAFSLQIATYGPNINPDFWLQIYNIPPAPKDTYLLSVGKMDTAEGAQVIVSTEVFDNPRDINPALITDQHVELGYISNVKTEEAQPIDISNIAFEGVVVESNGAPIPNCAVEIRDISTDTVKDTTNPFYNQQYNWFNFFKTLTDASGKFNLLKPVYGNIRTSTYTVQVARLGYKSDKQAHYYEGSRKLSKFQLETATGVIKGVVTLNDKPLPDAWVNLCSIKQEDKQNLGLDPQQSDTTGGFFNTVTRGDGSYEFNGVAPGNYNLEVNHNVLSKKELYWQESGTAVSTEPWKYRYVYDYGSDQKSTSTLDNQRIVLCPDMTSVVYSTAGSVLSTGDININLNVVLSTNAKITGFLYFPQEVTITAKDAIKVIAHPIDPQTHQFTEMQGIGTVYYADPTLLQGTTTFLKISIDVSTGTYFVEIKSDKWVPARSYNFEVVSQVDPGGWQPLPIIKMVKAGHLEGKIKLPDGSYFQATQDLQAIIRARGIDVEYGWDTMLGNWSPDPTRFTFDSLPPGRYNLWIEIQRMNKQPGSFTPPTPQILYPIAIIPNVRVTKDQTTFVEAAIKEGILCEPIAPIPPDKPEVDYSARCIDNKGQPYKGISKYLIVGLPVELPLKGSKLQALINNNGMLDDFKVPTLFFNLKSKQWQTDKLLAGKYNFYMLFLRRFGPPDGYPPEETDRNNPDEYFTIISRAENVNVKSDDLAAGATFQIKMGAGVMGPGKLTGNIKGTKILLPEDGDKIKGNFDEFTNYVPTVMLYDMDGALRGYSAARPSNQEIKRWEFAIAHGSTTLINNMINYATATAVINNITVPIYSPVHYYIDNIPTGQYVMVCETENYPPVTKVITVSTSTTIDINFDIDASSGCTITGTVTDENNNPICEANVIVNHRLTTKKTITDSSGTFTLQGLPAGIYRLDVMKPGYAANGEKIAVKPGETKSVTIKLKTAQAKITGKIYSRNEGSWAAKEKRPDVKIVAYNETENVTNPAKYLPAIPVKTDSEGSYVIPDIVLGNTYYVYCFVPDMPVNFKLVYVSTFVMANIDFIVAASTPTLKVVMKRTENPYIFRFFIFSPVRLIDPVDSFREGVPVCYYSPGRTFNEIKKIRALPVKGVKNSYSLDVEIPENTDEENYTLQIKGYFGLDKRTKTPICATEEVTFNLKALAKAKKDVDEQLAEGGSILMDDERADNTEVKLDPGTLTIDPAMVTAPSTDVAKMGDMPVGGFLSNLPNFKMSKTSKDISLLVDKAMEKITASDVYEIGLDNAQVNKAFDITLNYDRKKVDEDELDDLKVYRYNDTTEKWDEVKGQTTVDPLTGTISISADQIAASTTTPKAVVKNGVFAINRAGGTSQKASFVAFKQDPNTAKSYTGTDFEIYNFPNPFDLKDKEVTMADVAAGTTKTQSIKGTMLKYALPSDKTGNIKLYIYNLAGELVRTLEEGSMTGGKYYYTEWDGKNDRDDNCASGVYFLIAKKDGKVLNKKPLKMAIRK